MCRRDHHDEESDLFLTQAQLDGAGAELDGNVWRKGSEAWLPLYEAKMVHQSTHRWGDYALQPEGRTHVELPDVPKELLAHPTYVVQPRYWVTEANVLDRLPRPATWLLGFRDITGVEKSRTMIATVMPLVAAGHNLPLVWTATSPRQTVALLATLDSYVLDYAGAREVGGTHMTFFVVKQLPIPTPTSLDEPAPWSPGETITSWMTSRVLELTYTAIDLAGFAADLGYGGPPFRWNPEHRRHLRAELDAACFHIYGLERPEVEYVMETFPIIRRREEATYGRVSDKASDPGAVR